MSDDKSREAWISLRKALPEVLGSTGLTSTERAAFAAWLAERDARLEQDWEEHAHPTVAALRGPLERAEVQVAAQEATIARLEEIESSLTAERDAAIARAEMAEKERDEAGALLGEIVCIGSLDWDEEAAQPSDHAAVAAMVASKATASSWYMRASQLERERDEARRAYGETAIRLSEALSNERRGAETMREAAACMCDDYRSREASDAATAADSWPHRHRIQAARSCAERIRALPLPGAVDAVLRAVKP